MVAIAYDELSFQVPELLQSFELAPINRTATRRDVLQAENRFSFELFAREACHPIALAVNQQLAPHVNRFGICQNRNELIGEYNGALGNLNSMISEWTEFLKNVHRCNDYTPKSQSDTLDAPINNAIVARAQARARSESNRIEEQSLNSIAGLMKPIESALTAKFVSEHTDDLAIALANDHGFAVKDFVQNCAQSLIEMFHRNSVGVAQWYPGQNCRYMFFRRRTTNSYETFEDFDKRTVYGSTNTEITCHDHHLIDAFSCHVDNSPVPIPDRACRLIAQSPKWLKDQLSLIAGTMTQERIHVHKQLNRAWEITQVIPRLHFDPAICIGSFVLTGWGPRDVAETSEDELKRLTSTDANQTSRPNALSKAASFFSEWLGGE
ncbi:MAG: hypothetical protein SGI77_04480 [Pirellulaceae bacterium]|nr:hypothetical protein [Pirellulaceae bacterium]